MPTKSLLRSWGYGDPDEPGYFDRKIVAFTERGVTLTVHRGLVPVYRTLIREIEGFGIDLSKGIRDDWGYANRDIRGYPGFKSWHSVGGAVDLDATKNAMGSHSTTFPKFKTRRLATRIGLTWGLYFDRPDPMHFQVAYPLERMVQIAKSLKD